METERYIGIDGGSLESGFVVIDNSSKFVIIEKGIIENDKIFKLIDNCKSYNVKVLFEMISPMGMLIGQSTMSTIFWIARMYQACKERNINVGLITRKNIKMAICNSMRAKDKNIRQSLIDILGEPGKKVNPGILYKVSKHEWSAVAVVVAYFMQEGIKIKL